MIKRRGLSIFKAMLSSNRQSSVPAPFVEQLSQHRVKVALYDLEPSIEGWVAPNATIVGEVKLMEHATVWHNAVVRGDINGIVVGMNSSIGANSVLHTAAALPTGRPADIIIQHNVTIQNHCSLYSCHIENDVLVGARSVLLEGSRVGQGAVITPNSVVPPGRYIPAKQLWGGNPVEFIRDLDTEDLWTNYTLSFIAPEVAEEISRQFSYWGTTYLKKPTTTEDVDLESHKSKPNPLQYQERYEHEY